MPALTESVKTQAHAARRGSWLGPPLTTLHQAEFDVACAKLMRRVEGDFTPTMVVGIRTGGLTVARAMVRATTTDLPVLPITCQRAATAAKSRLRWLPPLLAALPQPLVDLLRRLEYRLLITWRARKPPTQTIDCAEAAAIAAMLATPTEAPRVLVADDAVDSGVTLMTVLRLLREICPAGTEIRSAAITQTTEHPAVRPDYVLYRGLLCRFPWSFDAVR
jgi:hypoxanthine phosphoribosyltransferase